LLSCLCGYQLIDVIQACDIVVRFDQLQHLVGYVQSRGRARNAASKFVVMIQKDDSVYLARYRSFSESEPHLRRTYQTRASLRLPVAPEEEEGEESETHPRDLADRERYVIKSTGAVLTYDTSISLLNYLCSLIPADPYTPLPMPKYGGDFQATLHLPHGLPLSQKDLVFSGPVKRTKKEAKRAVAFVAVRRMHELAVFDDYLLPAFGSDVDTDGTYSPDFNRVPEHMDVLVRDPWTTGGQLWLHVLHVDGCPTAGLITSSILPDIELVSEGHVYKTTRASRVCCGEDQIELLESFTMHGIMLCNTGRLFTPPLSCFLVPITNSLEPDFEFIDYLAGRFHGSNNWSRIGDDAYHQLILINVYEGGRTFLLQRIRHDLTPASKPPEGSLEAQFETYRDYFVDRYSRKRRPDFHPHVAIDEPLLEVLRLPKCVDGAYDLAATTPTHPVEAPPTVMNGGLLPRNCCRWLSFPLELYRAFYILPKLCRRITDVFRARQARFELGLPPIIENFLVEALMLPPSLAQWNNQRLETLGDSVLKLANTVHLFNCFPHRHEGQLSRMRHLDVSNKSLMTCAKVIGLERFLTCETQAISKWRYVESREQSLAIPATRFAQRRFPRRNLQDCMEAILGAAFLTGGIPMALYAGEALTMNLGGRIAWPQRYQRQSIGDDIPSLFTELQDNLGYRFRQLSLLTEAVTHPSFSDVTDTTSYQRLEFLGDGEHTICRHFDYRRRGFASRHRLGGNELPFQQVPRGNVAPVVPTTESRRLFGWACSDRHQASGHPQSHLNQ
jgi:endoribonuclease Dicer